MFASNPFRPPEEEDRKDIFGPVADLMVGVIFIFILLMFALSLNFQPDKMVQRADYERLKHQYEELNQRYEQEQTARADVERKLAQVIEENRRLVDFVHFVRDSNVKSLLERLSRADETRSTILREMKQELWDAHIAVNVNEGAGTLALPSTSLFASGQADPTVPNGRDTILRLGSVMSDVLPCYAAGSSPGPCGAAGSKADFSSLSAVYIEGHTDVVPFGSSLAGGRFRDNWDLSAARAIEAYKLIRDNSEVIRTIRNNQGEALVGVSGYADTRPASPDEGERTLPAAKDQDRRIEVRIIMSTNAEKVSAVLEELNRRLGAVDDLIR